MKTAIRYYSKFGHTTKMANIVGELTNTRPELATVRLTDPVDTLYLGAGVFLGKVDNSIVEFINTLTPDMVKRVVCFGSSAIIKIQEDAYCFDCLIRPNFGVHFM